MSQFTGWGSLTKKMGEEATQRKKEEEVEKKFVLQYGCTPLAYINAARKNVYKTNVSDPELRSEEGLYHTYNTKPSDSPSKLVQEYHEAEDMGKKLAQTGNLGGAMNYYDKAHELRAKYEEGMTVTGGHGRANEMLRARRNSLHDLIQLSESDPAVAEAKKVVRVFYESNGVPPPTCAI